jgi:hypothetical protein
MSLWQNPEQKRRLKCNQWRQGLWVLLACSLGAGAMEPDILGEAYDLDSGEYLYSEHHFCDEAFQRCRVEYIDNTGELIARKNVDFSANPTAPTLRFEDFRRERDVRKEFDAESELVVDSGFDNFIRSRWDALETGNRVEFPFLPAGREDPLNMEAVLARNSGCEQEQLCLEVALDSWFLQMLVEPIRLTYDRDSQRLLRFRGLSNIADAGGGGQNVDIRYSYSRWWR